MLRWILLASLIFTVSCSRNETPQPDAFGVREAIWKTLTNEQKSLVIEGYNRKMQHQAEAAIQVQPRASQAVN